MGKQTKLEDLIMGFDLHGEREFKGAPEIDWEKDPSFEEKEEYFTARQLFERDNPGYYFRNNVWYWRPLWQYVCNMCEDIVTLEDAERGNYNDYHLITKTKAVRIAKRLEKSIKNGDLQKWEQEREQTLAELGMVECDICEGTGYRNMDDSNTPTICNACKGKKEKPHFMTGYPWDRENLKQFIEFCKDSGGFRIG